MNAINLSTILLILFAATDGIIMRRWQKLIVIKGINFSDIKDPIFFAWGCHKFLEIIGDCVICERFHTDLSEAMSRWLGCQIICPAWKSHISSSALEYNQDIGDSKAAQIIVQSNHLGGLEVKISLA